MCNDKAACLLKQRQLKEERLLQGAIEDFWLNFQPRCSRREYDLNNPDKVMNQDGIQMLPGLVGEDPDSQGRLKKQQEQLREWSVQQQHELATARHQQRLEGRKQLNTNWPVGRLSYMHTASSQTLSASPLQSNSMTRTEWTWTSKLSSSRRSRKKGGDLQPWLQKISIWQR